MIFSNHILALNFSSSVYVDWSDSSETLINLKQLHFNQEIAFWWKCVSDLIIEVFNPNFLGKVNQNKVFVKLPVEFRFDSGSDHPCYLRPVQI